MEISVSSHEKSQTLFLAEKVMGWKHSSNFPTSTEPSKGEFQLGTIAGEPVIWIEDDIWQPTIDYSQALMVLEKCLKKISPCNLAMWKESGCKRIAAAMPEDYFFSKSKSLPEAICLFAKEVFSE